MTKQTVNNNPSISYAYKQPPMQHQAAQVTNDERVHAARIARKQHMHKTHCNSVRYLKAVGFASIDRHRFSFVIHAHSAHETAKLNAYMQNLFCFCFEKDRAQNNDTITQSNPILYCLMQAIGIANTARTNIVCRSTVLRLCRWRGMTLYVYERYMNNVCECCEHPHLDYFNNFAYIWHSYMPSVADNNDDDGEGGLHSACW